ncbi:hypothetical protein Trco_003359 [Trichoderma cornu-damae]|uniref:SRR1-like domain-containing protein n=1 Tax=Trichoderma cornu-damae TaxID=654480 RepID=A0A9P8QIJ7_9HYPO|nr:hypothetical protein Trco_003359 [Trichoderma cornu-damae]
MKNKFHVRVDCIFQEPMFNRKDIAFLEKMGFKVMNSPDANDLVDSTTFLFGVHLYRDVYAMSLKNNLPAIFVGTGWDVWSNTMSPYEFPEGDLDAIRKMDESYKKFAFPEESNSYIFYATSIYYRQPTVEQEEMDIDKGAVQANEELGDLMGQMHI